MTGCAQGHPLEGENLYLWTRPDGRKKRVCRTCQRDRQRRYRAANVKERVELPETDTNEMLRCWCAGLFEGEGTIAITTGGRGRYTALIVSLTMTDPLPPALLHGHWGGGLSVRQPLGRARLATAWRASGRYAARFIREMLPYLRTQRVRSKAELGLEYHATRMQGARHPEYRAQRMDFHRRMAELNRRGAS